MDKRLIALALLAVISVPAWAHRLDEYLQATILSIEPGAIQATMRFVPGVAVAPAVIATIDSNNDGLLSGEEQPRYAEAVLRDLELEEGGTGLPLHLISATFPAIELMKGGTGEIQLTFSARPAAIYGEHQLSFRNHHQSGISVYLVNRLVQTTSTFC